MRIKPFGSITKMLRASALMAKWQSYDGGLYTARPGFSESLLTFSCAEISLFGSQKIEGLLVFIRDFASGHYRR